MWWLLLYKFQSVSLDISIALTASRGDVEEGGELDPCRIEGGVLVVVLSSLLSIFMYSIILASNSDGASPGMGPAANKHIC